MSRLRSGSWVAFVVLESVAIGCGGGAPAAEDAGTDAASCVDGSSRAARIKTWRWRS